MDLYAVLNHEDTPHIFRVRESNGEYFAYGTSLCGATKITNGSLKVKKVYKDLRTVGDTVLFYEEEYKLLPSNLCKRCGNMK